MILSPPSLWSADAGGWASHRFWQRGERQFWWHSDQYAESLLHGALARIGSFVVQLRRRVVLTRRSGSVISLTERDGEAAFLRAERLPDGRRTFRIVPGEPLPTSHGQDIYRRIFGD